MPALPPRPAIDAPSAEWGAYAATLGAYALAHELAEVIELDGYPPVKVYQRGYPRGADERPGVAEALAAGDRAALSAAMGLPELVHASGDGRPVASRWCGCGSARSGEVFYARFSARGWEAHGWACADCRGISQTG